MICSGDRTFISGLHASDIPQFSSLHEPSVHTDVFFSLVLFLAALKSTAATGKFMFSSYPKIPRFYENAVFSDQKIPPKSRKTLVFFQLIVSPFFKWLLSHKKTYHLNDYVCCSRVVSWVHCAFGNIFILSACVWRKCLKNIQNDLGVGCL